LDLSFKCNKIW